jgi:hypothetical protein
MRKRRTTIILIGLIGTLLGLLLICGLGGAAVRHQVVEPPEVALVVQGFGFVAHTTNVPSCTLWFLACRVQRLDPGKRMYALWVVWKPSSPIEQPAGKRLFAMRILP